MWAPRRSRLGAQVLGLDHDVEAQNHSCDPNCPPLRLISACQKCGQSDELMLPHSNYSRLLNNRTIK